MLIVGGYSLADVIWKYMHMYINTYAQLHKHTGESARVHTHTRAPYQRMLF